jgi:transcriptional regulator with XRE-family HTH domain
MDTNLSGALERLLPVAGERTNRPFAVEVKRLLKEQNLSTRALAEKAGISQPHLSRLLRQVDYKKRPSEKLARSVAKAFAKPSDYFAEVRESAVIGEIKRNARLRDELYDSIVTRKERE